MRTRDEVLAAMREVAFRTTDDFEWHQGSIVTVTPEELDADLRAQHISNVNGAVTVALIVGMVIGISLGVAVTVMAVAHA